MPPLIPIIIGAAIAAPAIGAVAAGAAFAGLAGSLILLGSSLILSGISRALIKIPDFGDFETKAQSRLVSARQSAAPRILIYGLVRVGGVVTFLDKRGTNGEFLDVVLTLSGHEVEEIGQMYFDGVSVPLDGAGISSAASATGKFAGYVRVQKNLGADSQAALSDLMTANSQWTSNHRQRGCAHVWVELKFNPDLFPNGTPQITFDVKGAKVYDTRTSTTAYSANAALCLRDYLTKTKLKGGAGIAASLIPDSFVNAAANLADEDVTLDLGGTEDRYTCNGTVSTAEQPGRIIQQMLSDMAGKLVFTGGEWLMYGGAWRAATVSFDEDDLVGPIKVESRLPRRELFNAVKGVIVTSANKWQPSDFPPVTNSTYETEDGERLWKDVDFPFTTSAATAQRLAKIDLETARQQKTVRVRMNLKALQVNPPDVIQLSVDRFSWTNKNFEIAEQQLVWDDAGEAPALVVEMLLRETASTVYDWSSSEENQPTAPGSPDLPDPSVAAPPTSLVLSSLTETKLDIKFTFLKAAWTAPADEFVTNGGQIEIQYKTNASGTWIGAEPVEGDATEKVIAQVAHNVAYDVRIRSMNVYGARSSWVQELNFTVTDVASPKLTQLSSAGKLSDPDQFESFYGATRAVLDKTYLDSGQRPTTLRRAAGDITAAQMLIENESITRLGDRTLQYIADAGARYAAVEAGANKTETRTAAAISGQGALATKSSVDLATGEVTNKTAGNIAETAGRKYVDADQKTGAGYGYDGLRSGGQVKSLQFLKSNAGYRSDSRVVLLNGIETSSTGWQLIDSGSINIPVGTTKMLFYLVVQQSGGVDFVALYGSGDNVGVALATGSLPGTPSVSRVGNGEVTYNGPPTHDTNPINFGLYVRTVSGSDMVQGWAQQYTTTPLDKVALI